MKQIYELSQRLIVGLLIASVFIQSCTNFTTAAISKEEEPILEILSQVSNEGSVKQLAVSKFIPEKEHEAVLSSQAEELGNANHHGEALLTVKEEGKLEGQQEQKNEWDFAKDQTEEKVESLVKLVEVNKCNEKVEARCLGDLEILPIEIVEKILTYIPCDKIRKERRGEQKVTGIFAIRQINRFFYELTTGYSQPGLLGLEHRPNRCIHLEACAINIIIGCDKLNLKTIPSFIFYQFIRKVTKFPKEYWPYLKGTNIHTICAAPHPVIEAVELIKNLEGSKIDTLNFGHSYVGKVLGLELGEIAKNLQGSKVHTLILSGSLIKREAAVEFAKRLQGTQVHTLDLNSNGIGDESIIKIAKNLQGTQVDTLAVSRNNIGDEGIVEFAKNLQYTQVHTLDISNNNIGDEGIGEFAKRLQGTKVDTLDLSYNNIGKVGLMEFTKNLIGTEVKEINISHNKISWNKIKSTQEILEFGQILAATKVRKIDFSWCNTLPTEQKLLAKKYPHIDWKLR